MTAGLGSQHWSAATAAAISATTMARRIMFDDGVEVEPEPEELRLGAIYGEACGSEELEEVLGEVT